MLTLGIDEEKYTTVCTRRACLLSLRAVGAVEPTTMSQPFEDEDEELKVAMQVSLADLDCDPELAKALRLSMIEAEHREQQAGKSTEVPKKRSHNNPVGAAGRWRRRLRWRRWRRRRRIRRRRPQ